MEARLSAADARLYFHRLRHRRLPGSIWQSQFAHRSPAKRRQIVRSSQLPVVALHLASMALQRLVRGHLLRLVIARHSTHGQWCPQACRRAESASKARSAARDAQAAAPAAEEEAADKGETSYQTELNLVSRYLEAKMRHGGAIASYSEWVALRLMAWARMVPHRVYLRALKDSTMRTAALCLQHAWRQHSRRAPSRGRPEMRPPRAAFLIQRGWRGFTNRRIFAYLKDMLLFRESGDPRELLRSINPREAKMIDPATAIHVRFRLGGAHFPPTIHYKVYTHGPVTDLGAFAPRDYTAHSQPPPVVLHNSSKSANLRREMYAASAAHTGWYRRIENNGWRPVAGSALSDVYELPASVAQPVAWHHSKLVRREAAAQERKARKREWLRTMYALGKAGDEGGEAPPDEAEGEGEEDVDGLLEWSDALDFEAYHADWLSTATSAQPEFAEDPTRASVLRDPRYSTADARG
jgi:hypothetical protein